MGRTLEPTENQFYSPFSSVLVKAEEENGEWIVYLQASNEAKDQDEEVLLCKALKDAADYYMGHGVLSWDHLHKSLKDPGYIIGEPLDVRFSDKNETLVKGRLYQENKIAQSVWNNIRSGAKKLGASVGGGILRKSEDAAKGIKGLISKVVWDEVALTAKPVNDRTLGWVSTIPFPQFAKALMAGSGVDAGSFTGGRALTGESLQSEMVNILPTMNDPAQYEQMRKFWDELILAIKSGKISSYEDLKSFVASRGWSNQAAAKIIEFAGRKVPDIITKLGGK